MHKHCSELARDESEEVCYKSLGLCKVYQNSLLPKKVNIIVDHSFYSHDIFEDFVLQVQDLPVL